MWSAPLITDRKCLETYIQTFWIISDRKPRLTCFFFCDFKAKTGLLGAAVLVLLTVLAVDSLLCLITGAHRHSGGLSAFRQTRVSVS